MTEKRHTQDGRVRRRLTNTDRVLDAVCELGAEGQARITPELVRRRSGVSARSLHRYFPDQERLLLALLQRQLARFDGPYALPDPNLDPGINVGPGTGTGPGDGPLESRLVSFVTHRLRLHQHLRPVALLLEATPASQRDLTAALRTHGNALAAMVHAQFGPELAQMAPTERQRAALAVHVLCQDASIRTLTDHQKLSQDDIQHLLTSAIAAILGARPAT